jgi:catechol 2,3-dioxygenase-like lactoylglutathione lyase family enzyme
MPMSDMRKIALAALIVVGVFLVCCGTGMSSVAVGSIGVVLAIGGPILIFATTLRGNVRSYVFGTARVVEMSPAPTVGPTGRGELGLVIHARGIDGIAVRIRDPAIPLNKWPQVNATLPVRSVSGSPRKTIVLWADVRTHEEVAYDDRRNPEYADLSDEERGPTVDEGGEFDHGPLPPDDTPTMTDLPLVPTSAPPAGDGEPGGAERSGSVAVAERRRRPSPRPRKPVHDEAVAVAVEPVAQAVAAAPAAASTAEAAGVVAEPVAEPVAQAAVAPTAAPATEAVATDPQDVLAEPHDVLAEPQDVVAEPQEVVVEPQDVLAEQRDAVAEPHDVIVEPQDVRAEQRDVLAEPDDVIVEPQDVRAEPSHVLTERRDAVTEPQDVVAEPQDVVAAPRDATVESQEATVGSRAPEDFQSQVATVEPEDIEAESAAALPAVASDVVEAELVEEPTETTATETGPVSRAEASAGSTAEATIEPVVMAAGSTTTDVEPETAVVEQPTALGTTAPPATEPRAVEFDISPLAGTATTTTAEEIDAFTALLAPLEPLTTETPTEPSVIGPGDVEREIIAPNPYATDHYVPVPDPHPAGPRHRAPETLDEPEAETDPADVLEEEVPLGAIAEFLPATPQRRPVPLEGVNGVSVTLIVSDLQRSLRFYRETLGLSEVDSNGSSAVLASGDARVVLRRSADMPPVDRRVVHLNLEVPDVYEAYERLKAEGVEFVHRPRVVPQGEQLDLCTATFRDPDGHAISVIRWELRR